MTSAAPAVPGTFTRRIERVVVGTPTRDGAGVSLVRVLTSDLQRRLDPFLMLDAFNSDRPDDYIAGFPEHPHRGFETVTYMLEGRLRHRDSAGNEGLLTPGSVQWMTAGRGLVHAEMPEQEDGRLSGFQLWINLPARDKMGAPGYRDIAAADIPEAHPQAGTSVRVIAGSAFGVLGAVQKESTEPLYLDVSLAAGRHLDLPIPSTHNAFLYVFDGALEVGLDPAEAHIGRMAILSNDRDADGVRVTGQSNSRFLLIAGRPLNEPIAQAGPFVMNTREEVEQAIRDYQSGHF
jgi:redox-sensitive bicupin YhaK (pirin superfamily)